MAVNENLNVQQADLVEMPDDVIRIFTLAGLKQPEMPHDHVHAADAHAGCDSCGDMEHEQDACPYSATLDEEQAEYDYSAQENDSEGHEVDPSTYIYNGSKLPQRIVKGTQGDNPLISEIHASMINKYAEFLAEERENEAGNYSPLSDPTKPEFDKDPLSDETPVDDGSHSPMSTIERQPALK